MLNGDFALDAFDRLHREPVRRAQSENSTFDASIAAFDHEPGALQPQTQNAVEYEQAKQPKDDGEKQRSFVAMHQPNGPDPD